MFLSKKKIYIVEDNTANIFVLLSALRQEGAIVVIDWFADGKTDRILKDLPIDLIILDLMLPGSSSGFDIFESLRAIPELNEIPIVAVSAMDTSVGIPKAQELGFSGFISKPIDVDKFPQQILALIEGEKIWDS
jgi:CheY-like chemotaxis protein